jgi:uncharacterized protein (DUF58 family)
VLAYPAPRAVLIGLSLLALATAGYAWPIAITLAAWLTLVFGLVLALDLLFCLQATRGKLRLERELPRNATVTHAVPGFHIVHNSGQVAVKARAYEDVKPNVSKEMDTAWRGVTPGEYARWPIRITGNRRGSIHLGGTALRYTTGLRLWIVQQRFELDQQLRVYPLIEELVRGDLFAHRRRLYSIGQHSSHRFGRGTEFEQLREYSPDDEYRQINWKATARAAKPVVNQMRVEQSRDLILMIDCGRLMHTDIAGRPRLDRYLDAAVQLAYLALNQRDRVGLIAFDAEVRRYVAPGHRPRQLNDLIDAVYDLQPRFVESDYSRAALTLRTRLPKRGMVVLFTDLLDSVSSRQAVAELSRLARTHLPLIVVLDDPAIPAIADRPTLREMDVYEKSAAEKFITEKRRALQQLRTRGCLIVNVAAEKLNVAVVNQYLEVKSRNML